jgi:hypothetical protein
MGWEKDTPTGYLTKGSSLSHVDFLSRNPVSVLRVSPHESWFHIQQKGDAEAQQMLNDLREGKLDPKQYLEKEIKGLALFCSAAESSWLTQTVS